VHEDTGDAAKGLEGILDALDSIVRARRLSPVSTTIVRGWAVHGQTSIHSCFARLPPRSHVQVVARCSISERARARLQ
jgi:hypothetical protein